MMICFMSHFVVYANFICVSSEGSCENKANKSIIILLTLTSLSLSPSSSPFLFGLQIHSAYTFNVQGWHKNIAHNRSININIHIYHVGAAIRLLDGASDCLHTYYYYYYYNIFLALLQRILPTTGVAAYRQRCQRRAVSVSS